MPLGIANKIKDFINTHPKRDLKIFIMGFSFKGNPSVDDTRESATVEIVRELRSSNNDIHGHDPAVPPEKLRLLGVHPTSIKDGFNNADIVLIMTNDSLYAGLDVHQLVKTSSRPLLIVDCWRLYEANLFGNGDITYFGVGLGK
jgi:UDP-N-acetyl-D-mannosaminuronic acid dehydrogenase